MVILAKLQVIIYKFGVHSALGQQTKHKQSAHQSCNYKGENRISIIIYQHHILTTALQKEKSVMFIIMEKKQQPNNHIKTNCMNS